MIDDVATEMNAACVKRSNTPLILQLIKIGVTGRPLFGDVSA
jgi:hypothetical protein